MFVLIRGRHGYGRVGSVGADSARMFAFCRLQYGRHVPAEAASWKRVAAGNRHSTAVSGSHVFDEACNYGRAAMQAVYQGINVAVHLAYWYHTI